MRPQPPAPVSPLLFYPHFVPKPWGGRRLGQLLGKGLPPDTPIGESWELAGLPEHNSVVRCGPHAGARLRDLARAWGPDLFGFNYPADRPFPLLLKFLDATEHLSVQAHPKPRPAGPTPGLKNEAWYVVHAEPGAQVFIGLTPEATPERLRAARGREFAELLKARPARPGDCFFLPSGTPHALGAGLVVAEIQTPSDVTYRLYDWGRVDEQGRPRELHIEQAVANIRWDVSDSDIEPPRVPQAAGPPARTRICTTDAFVVDELRAGGPRAASAGGPGAEPPEVDLASSQGAGRLRVWMFLSGGATLRSGDESLRLARGDVVLLPAALPTPRVQLAAETLLLEIRLAGAP